MSTDLLVIFLTVLILGLFGICSIGALILFLAKDTTKIPELIRRATETESIVRGVLTDIGSRSGQELWKTSDGKYEADSFEELVMKMMSDPGGPLTADEIEAFQSIFRKISGEADPDGESEKWQ